MIHDGNTSKRSEKSLNYTVLHIYNVYNYIGYRSYGNNIQYNKSYQDSIINSDRVIG